MVVGVGRQEGGGRGRSKRKEAAEEEQLKTRKRKSSPWKKGRTQGGRRPQQTAQQGTRGAATTQTAQAVSFRWSQHRTASKTGGVHLGVRRR